KEVLSAAGHVPAPAEVVVKGLNSLLDQRDPVRKAKRAAAKAQTPKAPASEASPTHAGKIVAPGRRGSVRTAIPAAANHLVDLRAGEQCTAILPDGRRCPERGMLEYDHDDLVCRGGRHDPERLHKKCRSHNQSRARKELGDYYMDRWRQAVDGHRKA